MAAVAVAQEVVGDGEEVGECYMRFFGSGSLQDTQEDFVRGIGSRLRVVVELSQEETVEAAGVALIE